MNRMKNHRVMKSAALALATAATVALAQPSQAATAEPTVYVVNQGITPSYWGTPWAEAEAGWDLHVKLVDINGPALDRPTIVESQEWASPATIGWSGGYEAGVFPKARGYATPNVSWHVISTGPQRVAVLDALLENALRQMGY